MPPAVIAISSPDKIKLAEHLTKEGAVMYNAYWCPHCHDQKEMFGKEAAEKLNLVECAKDGFNNKRELCEAKKDGCSKCKIRKMRLCFLMDSIKE